MEHKIIIDEIDTDADVVVRFQGLDTKLIMEEDGYFFEKLSPTTNVEYQDNLNEYSYLLTDIRVPTEWVFGLAGTAEMKKLRAVCIIVAAMKDFGFLEEEEEISHFDRYFLESKGIETELISNGVGYWFKKTPYPTSHGENENQDVEKKEDEDEKKEDKSDMKSVKEDSVDEKEGKNEVTEDGQKEEVEEEQKEEIEADQKEDVKEGRDVVG